MRKTLVAIVLLCCVLCTACSEAGTSEVSSVPVTDATSSVAGSADSELELAYTWGLERQGTTSVKDLFKTYKELSGKSNLAEIKGVLSSDFMMSDDDLSLEYHKDDLHLTRWTLASKKLSYFNSLMYGRVTLSECKDCAYDTIDAISSVVGAKPDLSYDTDEPSFPIGATWKTDDFTVTLDEQYSDMGGYFIVSENITVSAG